MSDKNENTTLNLSLEKWIKYMKPSYLKIGDIKSLKKGDKLHLLCLDRNVYDLADSSQNKNSRMAEDFFKNNYQLIYTHSQDLEGYVEWIGISESDSDSDSDSDNESLNKTNLVTNFTFDLNYMEGCWYPLKNGRLPDRDPQGFATINSETEKLWSNYPDNTFIGWRGPMINFKDLANSPNLYYID